MNKQIEILKKTRQRLLELIKDLTIEQLNEVPKGFNNNIIWNLGHLIAAQQGLTYMRSGMPMFIDEQHFLTYKPETKPEQFVDAAEVENLKQLFIACINQFETDYQNNLFANYNIWTNRFGVELVTIEDAIPFIIFHEGLHLGYIMALKRCVIK